MQKLSPKEQAILTRLLEGKTNKEIGNETNSSESTIKHQMTQLLKKFNVNSRNQLVIKVLKNAY